MIYILIVIAFLTASANAQGVDDFNTFDMRVRIENCTYEIGQRSQVEAAWTCVVFNPVSVGDHPSLWKSAERCQAVRGQDKHALWGNYIVLWPVDCGTPDVPVITNEPIGGTLRWDAPEFNTDGSVYDDPGGYIVYCNDQNWVLNDPDARTWPLDDSLYNIVACSVRAFDDDGNVSDNSSFAVGNRPPPPSGLSFDPSP